MDKPADQSNGGNKKGGLVAFFMIWSTQIVSTLASGMASFALSIWMYQQTRSATLMALIQVSFITPFLVMSFFSGPLIDRYSRKLMMAMSDLVAILGTFGVMLAFLGGIQAPWMLCVSAALGGIGNAFQWPAFSAAISTMVPKEQLGRANGMMSLMESGPGIVAPLLAGALLPVFGITGILIIDVVTFILAVLAIFVARIPDPPRTVEGKIKKRNIFQDSLFGFQYIFERKSLLHLQLFFLFCNLFSGMARVLVAPMILARFSMSAIALGSANSAAALGSVLGGLVMTAWGGFKKRTRGVFAGWLACALFGNLLFGMDFPLAAAVLFLAISVGFVPLLNGSNQAIWQSKVPPDLQGRVFSARRLIAWVTLPLAPLIAGFLADYAFEPLMNTPGSTLATALAPVFGSGTGSGTGLLISLCGAVIVVLSFWFWSKPSVRNAETVIPDYKVVKEA